MKRVGNHGGLVSFEVPEYWVVEHEDGGAVVCFDADDPTEATLRLGILVFSPREELDSREAFDRFLRQEGARHRFTREELGSGALLVDSFEQVDAADDPNTAVRYWKLAQLGEDGTIRVALFSYAHDRTERNGVLAVDRIVRSAVVSTAPGGLVN